MGIFSTKHRIVADVSVTPIVEDYQDFTLNPIFRSIFGGENMATSLTTEILHGFGSKVKSFYRIAKRSELIGLPTGTILGGSIPDGQLQGLLPANSVIQYRDISYSNPIYLAWKYLSSVGTYNYTTNTFTQISGKTYSLSDAEFDLDKGKLKIFLSDNGDIEEIKTPLELFDHNDRFLTVVGLGADGTFTYVYYNINSNTIPSIQLPEGFEDTAYFPALTIRANRVNVYDSTNLPLKKVTKKLARRVGLSLKKVSEELLSTEDGQEPEKIQDVFLAPAIPIDTERNITQQYLFKFFKDWQENKTRGNNEQSYEDFLSSINSANSGDSFWSVEHIQVKHAVYDVHIFCNQINSVITTGEIGRKNSTEVNYVLRGDREVGSGALGIKTYNLSDFIIKMQISPTQYETITISGLQVAHDITAFGKRRVILRSIDDTFSITNVAETQKDQGLYIPLNNAILRTFNPFKEADIAQEAFGITVYATVKQRVPWYKRGIFKYIIQIILIIISIVLANPYGIAAAFTLNTLITIIVNIAIGIAIKLVLPLVIDILGLDGIKWLLVVIAIIAIAYGVNVDFSILADNLINIVKVIPKVLTLVQGGQLHQLQSEMSDWTKTYEEQIKELEQKQQLLEGNTSDLVSIITQPNPHHLFEEPEGFIVRTTQFANPSLLSYSFIENFYELMVQPPSPADTMMSLIPSNTTILQI